MHLAVRLAQKQLAQQKRKRQQLRPLYPPLGIEYQRALTTYARMCERLTRELVFDQLERILGQSTAPVPTARADDLSTDLERAIRRLRAVLEAGGEPFMRAVRRMLDNVHQSHARNFVEAYGTSIAGINPTIGAESWLREQIELATLENVRLIRSVPEQLLGDVQRIIVQGARDGTHAKDLGELISARFGITERRARFIARDQTAKWHSSVNLLRMVDAGVEEVWWSTSLDEKVRPTHRENHGKRYPINKPPAKTGHAGHDAGCRCCEVPVVPEYEDAAAEAEASMSYEEARAARDRRLYGTGA